MQSQIYGDKNKSNIKEIAILDDINTSLSIFIILLYIFMHTNL